MARARTGQYMATEDHVEALLKGTNEHGLKMIKADGSVTHVPITAFPSRFPRSAYQEALALQPLFNKLVVELVRERRLLLELAAEVSKYDSFIKGLYDIFQRLPPIARMFGVTRSDYMLSSEGCLLQIEMNTISVAFVSFSSHLALLHKTLIDLKTEDNRSLDEVSLAFEQALNFYKPDCKRMLMVVRPDERNTFDQDLLVAHLRSKHNISVVKITLNQAVSKARLGPNNELLIDGLEYGVVYYRSGYTASDYPSDVEWKGRLILESSCALKCPDVGSQLAGMKKTQQVLAELGILERFLSPKECEQVRCSFAGLYALESDAVIDMVLSAPQKYVLKPQREGGGNNLYGEEMVDALKTMSADERRAWIVMELIEPLPFNSVFLREDKSIACEAVSELGIFGTFLFDGELVSNKAAGYLLRTKAQGVLEGGVASGFSVLDSLHLTT